MSTQLQVGGVNLHVSIPAGAACCCSLSVTSPCGAHGVGVAAESAQSTCVTLQISTMPGAVSPGLPPTLTARSSCAIPTTPVSRVSSTRLIGYPTSSFADASRTPSSSPPIAMSRIVSQPTVMPITLLPPSAPGIPASSLAETASTPVASPTAISRTASSRSIVPRNLLPSSIAPPTSPLRCVQFPTYATSSPCSLAATPHMPDAESKPPITKLQPCPRLVSPVQKQDNTAGLPLRVASSAASTATASSAAPSVAGGSSAYSVPSVPSSSPAASCPDSPEQQNLEPLHDGFDASRGRCLWKAWSASTMDSLDEAWDRTSTESPVLCRTASRAKTLCLPGPFSELLDDYDITYDSAARHKSKHALQKADEARERLSFALELLEAAQPQGFAVKEELQQAMAQAASVDLSWTTLLDLTEVQDRLKNSVAKARSFYLSGVNSSSPKHSDSVFRALQALKVAIDVANSACALLLETSLLFRENYSLQGSGWREDVDLDALQFETSSLIHIARLQEIRCLLAKVLTIAGEFQLSLDEIQEAEMHRRKLHTVIQDLKGQVRVCCRLRNLSAEEQISGKCSTVNVLNETTLEVLSNGMYEFDQIFAPGTQEEVFEDCRDLVQSAIDGRNITIFTYGQTGSGKTYTMYGTGKDEGIAPRAVSELFESVEQLRYTHDVSVTASMVELYQSKLYDMLCGRGKRGDKLRIRDDRSGAVWIEGLEEMSVRDVNELQEVLRRGIAQRATASHAMNRDSSRSHLIFTIKISSVSRSTGETINGKILLCDLAGSERIKKTEVEGERQKEAIDINKSLAALGNVIVAVATKKKQIPYRDHKLTQLMRDSLGGTAKTLMFVNSCTSPSDLSQTVSSLAYATRASQIYNKGASRVAKIVS